MKIFLTGATGYVGGEALYHIYNASRATSAQHNISALVRHANSDAQILKAFPEVRIVRGDLDAVDLIEQEAKNADAVFHLASTKHLPSSEAIVKGLSSSDRKGPGYWVQMSGASMFSGEDISQGTYGEPPSRTWNDLKDTKEIRSTILNSSARVVDHLVLAQDPAKVKTALISGPLIYGTGKGPGNTRSIQTPEMARVTLQKGEGFRVCAGKSVWSNIHISDLGLLFERLLNAAVEQKTDCWNENGVYAVENGKMAFGQLGALIAAEAHAQGLIKSPEVSYVMKLEEANQAMPHGAVMWATNAQTEAERARKQLGWQPAQKDLKASIPEAVKLEASKLSLHNEL